METFKAFEDLLFDLSYDFTIYKQLFSNDDSVKILNKFNPIIFGNYQKALMNSIFTKISRLLDHAYTFKNENKPNLSLDYFITEHSLKNDECIKREYDSIIEIYKSSNLEKYRHKVSSHNDANTAIRAESIVVSLDFSEVEELIEQIGNLYFTIKYKSGNEEANIAIDPLITLPFGKDGYAFINKLKKSDT